VSGDNTIIPTRIERKRAKPRKSKKSVLVHGFKITPLGEQEYFGFTLDGDRRYLTGNFFVTHNTVCLGYVAAKFGQPTLIVVTKEDLARQWKDSLINVLKIPPSLVGHIQQDTCDWEGKRFVVGTVQSLIIPDRYPTAMYKYFGLMVLDECHLMASECFVRVCQIFPAKYRVGVSATPTRKDGKTKLLDWHIGPTLVTGTVVSMKPKVLVSNTGWAIPNRPVKVQGDLQMRPIPHSPGRMMQVFKALASNEARNLSIAEFVVQAYNKGRTCLILSDLKEYHLDRLFQLITSAGVPGNEIGYYVGGMSEQELKRTKKCRVALGTYAMCSTGTDVPQWDTLVMATPRADVKQSVGRVLRFQEGKKTPVVLDLVDKDSIFRGFHRARLTQYHSLGAEIVEVGG
jgi:superfamily II DNA or RNA helicase